MPYSYTFQVITSNNITKAIPIYQKKPRLDLELDSALQAKEDIIPNRMQLSESIIDETLIKVGMTICMLMVMDCYRVNC